MTRADVARLHHEFRDTPYQSNRNLEIVSKMFNLAEMWGLRPDGSNPCRHVKKYKEEKRERYLSVDELGRLGKVLRECEQEGVESASTINLIRLLMLTGCRLSEIQTLKWENVDFENRALHLPDSKTGVKTVHLGPPALKVLIGIERIEGNPWVITGKLENTHLQEPQRPWRRIRARAGLDDARIPRSAPYLRVHGGLERRGPADDRQAAGPHSGTDHGSLCPSVQRARQTGGREYFIQYRGGVGPEGLVTHARPCDGHRRARTPIRHRWAPKYMPVCGFLGLLGAFYAA